MSRRATVEVGIALTISICILASLALIGLKGEQANSSVIAPLFPTPEAYAENPTEEEMAALPTARLMQVPATPSLMPSVTPAPSRTPLRTARTPTPVQVVVSSLKREFVYYQGAATYVRTDALVPLALAGFPRPMNDNGRGLHWFPTTRQSRAVVDRFIPELVALRVRWLVILQGMNDWDLVANDFLIDRLNAAGIVPVMRIVMQVGAPDYRRLGWIVARYRERGVRYFQVFNEPNVEGEWTASTPHSAEQFAEFWAEAAQVVAANGGLPGLAPLSPQADNSDLAFFKAALEELEAGGHYDVLNLGWISVHNYGGLAQNGFWRYRQYDAIAKQVLGASLPIIVTEGGMETASGMAEVIGSMYGFVEHDREPYLFAFAPWLIGNQVGGGHDPLWEMSAWYTGTLDRVQPRNVVDQVKKP